MALLNDYWSDDHGKELLDAVENNDQTSLKALLDNDRSTMKKSMYMPVLIQLLKVAIDWRNIDIISMLLRYGVCVTSPIYTFKQTALHYAAKTRHQKIISEILQRSINWRAADGKGRTVLHLIIENEEPRKNDKTSRRQVGSRTQGLIIEICQIFLNIGMPVDVKTKTGETPLYMAVKYEMRKVAKYFIECGAALDVSNEKGDSLLHILVKNEFGASIKYNDNIERLKRIRSSNVRFMNLLLSKGLNVDSKNYNGETATQLAIEKNIIHLLPSLFKYTKNVNFLYKRNETSLHRILSKNNKDNGHCSISATSESWSIDETNDIVDVLLNRGASVDAVDSRGRTPLHIALEQKRYKIVLRMLKRFTNINASDKQGDTVLHIAIQNYVDDCSLSSEVKSSYKHNNENLKIIRTLLSKGADLKIRNKTGMMPLHVAAENKLITILQIFKRHGADFSLRTKNGENVLHLISKKNAKVVCLEPQCTPHEAMMKLLMNHECDINATTKDGLTPVHLAVMSGSIDVVKVLIAYGADVNFQQKKTLLSPLHLASMVGVIWDTKNLQCAVKSLQRPSKDFYDISDDVIWILVRSGSNINARDVFGRTALHLATYRRSCIIRTLLDLGAQIDAQDQDGRLPLQNALDYGNPEGIKTLLHFGVDINDIGTVFHLSDQQDSHGMSVHDYMLEHLTKLRAVDLPLAKVYESFVYSSRQQCKEYYKNCFKEVENLKSFMIKADVSLYDLLHMNPHHRYYYFTRNMKLVNLSFKLEFPKYHSILKASKREALERKSLVEPAKRAWCKLVKFNLPDICVEHILSYLKNSSLKVMITVLLRPGLNDKSILLRRSYQKTIHPLVKARNVMQMSRISILTS